MEYDQLLKGGFGVYLLFLYTVLVIHQFQPDQHELKAFAAIPAVFVMFVSYLFNNKMVDFFAGGSLKETAEQIDVITGDDHYFEGISEQAQNRIDRYDQNAYRQNNSILSGLIMGVSAPIVGFVLFEIWGLLAGLVVTVLSYKFLFVQPINELNLLATELVEVYEADYENH